MGSSHRETNMVFGTGTSIACKLLRKFLTDLCIFVPYCISLPTNGIEIAPEYKHSVKIIPLKVFF